jgi:hypothetical protein
VPFIALLAIPTPVPSVTVAAPVSAAPSVAGPQGAVPTVSAAPSVPNTSFGGRFSGQQDTIRPLIAVTLAGIGLLLMAALCWRPQRESDPR